MSRIPFTRAGEWIGETVRGKDIGRQKGSCSKLRYYWLECPKCDKPRWISEDGCCNNRATRMCSYCASGAGKKPKHEPYTRLSNKHGYVTIVLPPTDPYYCMAKDGRVAEHRYVMAKRLGRKLIKGENVHHKNGVRNDNRIENLELWVKPQMCGIRADDYIVDYMIRIDAEQREEIITKILTSGGIVNRSGVG